MEASRIRASRIVAQYHEAASAIEDALMVFRAI